MPERSTDRKSLLALRGVARESGGESVPMGRRVTRVGPGSQHIFGLRGAPTTRKAAAERWGPMNNGCERRTWALPGVSAGGERHDWFGVVVGAS
jgi:hypothetical protein